MFCAEIDEIKDPKRWKTFHLAHICTHKKSSVSSGPLSTRQFSKLLGINAKLKAEKNIPATHGNRMREREMETKREKEIEKSINNGKFHVISFTL